jgi:hypothetical protein
VGGEYRRHQLDGDLQEGRNRRHNYDEWFDFLTVGFRDPDDSFRARQISDTSTNFGETLREYRLTDWNWFIADDWKVSPSLTLNIGVRHEYFGFPSEVNGLINVFDYPGALASGSVQDGFIFPSNFNASAVPGAEGADLNIADSESLVPGDYNNFMPRVGFAWTPTAGRNVVVRGGYGIFFERITGSFANSQRQSAPLFRENQRNDAGDWNEEATDINPFPIPEFVVGFDDGEPQLETTANPGVQFEAFESQMVDPNLSTPYMQQWNLSVQWEFKPDWLIEVGYIGSKGTKLMQSATSTGLGHQRARLSRAGVSAGASRTTTAGDDDEFINTRSPCDLFDDPATASSRPSFADPLGFDEDEGSTPSPPTRTRLSLPQTSLTKRFSQGFMFNVNYTFSRYRLFSDEDLPGPERPAPALAQPGPLSDFHRKHRLIFSWVWDLPFKGNRFAEGWQISGVGTFQSGRPLTVIDDDFSAVLYSTTDPRPNLAPGATHEDQTTSGSVSSRVDNYLNRDA